MFYSIPQITAPRDLRRMLGELYSGEVEVEGYKPCFALHELVAAGQAKVLSKQWRDSIYQDNPDIWPLDLKKRDTWLGDGSQTLSIKRHPKGLLIKVTFFESSGHYYQGWKWQAQVLAPRSFITQEHVVSEINGAYNQLLKSQQANTKLDRKRAKFEAYREQELKKNRSIFRKGVTFTRKAA